MKHTGVDSQSGRSAEPSRAYFRCANVASHVQSIGLRLRHPSCERFGDPDAYDVILQTVRRCRGIRGGFGWTSIEGKHLWDPHPASRWHWTLGSSCVRIVVGVTSSVATLVSNYKTDRYGKPMRCTVYEKGSVQGARRQHASRRQPVEQRI